MAIIDPRTGLERLSVTGCWELMERSPVGRIGVLVDSVPEIYPVNFVVDARTIVFRTAGGDKVRGLGRSPSVSFEVDAVDTDGSLGWSVLVRGTAAIEPSSRALEALGLRSWVPGERSTWVRISPWTVAGRRLRPTP